MKKILMIVFLGVGICIFLSACFPATPTPTLDTSGAFVESAWNSFNKNKYSEAIAFAQECINRWEKDAVNQQSALTQAPPNGKVADDEKKAIFENWALNDVGTAYFIKAWSLEKMGKSADAKDGYKKTLEFPYARCWDDKGWFWSPAERAKENLAKLP